MSNETLFRQKLNHVTDSLVIGLCMAAASLLLVTAFAGLRAGVAVLSAPEIGGNLAFRFMAALQEQLHKNLRLGVFFLAATGVGVTDVLFAFTGALGTAGILVAAAGVLLLLAAVVLPWWASATLRDVPDTSAVVLLRHTSLVAAAHPARSAVLFITVLAGLAATAAAPILAPMALGVLARLASQLPTGTPKPSINV